MDSYGEQVEEEGIQSKRSDGKINWPRATLPQQHIHSAVGRRQSKVFMG